jgi:peptidoglycan/LPS O-acetylase OafA/YrhL
LQSGVSNEKLVGIQTARGIAALLVVFYHSARMISLPQYAGYIPFGNVLNFGHAGVDFFFVLSGFIIYYVHQGDIGSPRGLPRYLWRRITRIYPVYWVVTAMVLALQLFSPTPDPWDPGHVVKSLLLIPEGRDPVLGVAWTLTHEMLFYLVFAVAILNRRIGVLVFAAWAGLVVVQLLDPIPPGFLRFLAAPYHLQFFMGIAAAHLTKHANIPMPRLVAMAGTLAFFTVAMAENAGLFVWAGPLSQILYGLSAMLIVLGLAVAELRGEFKVGAAGAFLGAASYSIYLIHTVVIGPAARILMNLGLVKIIPAGIVFAMVAVAALIAASILYYFAERPLLLWFQRIGRDYVYARRPLAPAATA